MNLHINDIALKKPMLELVALAGGFVVLSGLMAMIDAAILSVSRAEVEAMVQENLTGSHALRRVSHRITQAVVIIVILTNTINILGPILVGQKAIELFGSQIIGLITGILTFLTIVFSEIIPKSLGAHYAPVISRFAAPPVVGLIYILYPLVRGLEKLAVLFQTGKRVIGTEEQIRSLATIGREAGHIESDEGQLIHRAFILNDKSAKDLMTPLKDMVGVQHDKTISEAAKVVFNHTFSRYPVFGASIHEVQGIAMSKDILEALAEGEDKMSVIHIMRDPMIIPSYMSADALLVRFRDKHIHLGIVQEDGKTIGLITLEDVLEELVGEIEDETDVED